MCGAARRGGTKWRIMTGNKLGIALGWWCFHVWRARNPHADAAQLYMFGSTVSTHFIAALARHEGFHYEVHLQSFSFSFPLSKCLSAVASTATHCSNDIYT